MYDEDQLMNEFTNAVKTSAQSIAKLVEIINEQKEKTTVEALTKSDSDFIFTGQSTDLRYFQNNSEMPISLINNISDERVKNAVIDEFNKSALAHHINIDKQSGVITITDEGKKFINTNAFKKAVSIDLDKHAKENIQELAFELDGTTQDLNYFQYSDKLDLNAIITSPDTATAEKVLKNINELKEQGLVVAEKSIVKLTDKGKDVINSSIFKAATKGSTEKLLSACGAPGKIAVVTKKAAEVLAKAVTTPINR